MSTLLPAIDELITRATTSGTLQDLQGAIAQVHQRLDQVSAAERNEALRGLGANLPKMHPIPAAKIAVTCGALVEAGGDPNLSSPALLPLLPNTLDGTIQFHELCEQK